MTEGDLDHEKIKSKKVNIIMISRIENGKAKAKKEKMKNTIDLEREIIKGIEIQGIQKIQGIQEITKNTSMIKMLKTDNQRITGFKNKSKRSFQLKFPCLSRFQCHPCLANVENVKGQDLL